jgi:hypothetical protein
LLFLQMRQTTQLFAFVFFCWLCLHYGINNHQWLQTRKQDTHMSRRTTTIELHKNLQTDLKDFIIKYVKETKRAVYRLARAAQLPKFDFKTQSFASSNENNKEIILDNVTEAFAILKSNSALVPAESTGAIVKIMARLESRAKKRKRKHTKQEEEHHKVIINTDVTRIIIQYVDTMNSVLNLRLVSKSLFCLIHESTEHWFILKNPAIVYCTPNVKNANFFPWIRYASIYLVNHWKTSEEDALLLNNEIKECHLALKEASLIRKKVDRIAQYAKVNIAYFEKTIVLISGTLLHSVHILNGYFTKREAKYAVKITPLFDYTVTNASAPFPRKFREYAQAVFIDNKNICRGDFQDVASVTTVCCENGSYINFSTSNIHIHCASIHNDIPCKGKTFILHLTVADMYTIDRAERDKYKKFVIETWNDYIAKYFYTRSKHKKAKKIINQTVEQFPWTIRLVEAGDIEEAILLTDKSNLYYLALTNEYHVDYHDYLDPKHTFARFDKDTCCFVAQ